MKILLSAYACSPGLTSEPGVGWRWACALAEEHQVVVLTHERFRRAIENELLWETRPGLSFAYHDSPLGSRVPFGRWTAIPKYVLWQYTVMPLVRQLDRVHDFDVVWHLTMGTFRYPSWLGMLGKPFFFGPVGGGERAPARLFCSLPLRVRCTEYVRDLVIRSARIDPLLRLALARTRVVFAKTEATARAIPGGTAAHVVRLMEVGQDGVCSSAVLARMPGETFTLLLVARLLGWKGVHLAIAAVRSLRERGYPVVLQIVGDGPLRKHLEDLARGLKLRAEVQFMGALQHAEVMDRMGRAHCFLFPSLHDSSGNAVVEALSVGLPVVCLDLGGPAHLVDESCGRVVPVDEGDEAAVASALVDALIPLIENEELRRSLGCGALTRAASMSWARAVEDALRVVVAHAPAKCGDSSKRVTEGSGARHR